MRAVVIYHSGFGNTKTVAEALASGIREQGVDTDCMGIDEVQLNELPRYDLLAIGGPTHMLRASKPMQAFLKEMKSVDLKGKFTFCFDTRNETGMNSSGLSIFENSAARGIEGKVKRMKMKVIRPRESALVDGREGPLHSGAEEQFLLIGKEIGNLLTSSIRNADSATSSR